MNENLLEIKDLHVNVGEKEILKGLNLNIKKGEIHVIMGPNGAGKSTLANVILNNPEYTKTNGTVEHLCSYRASKGTIHVTMEEGQEHDH